DGTDLTLRVRAVVRGERLTLDFAGSAPQHEGNLNCPLAVTRSACLFAVRVLTDPDIPPSAGAYRPIDVRAPEGTVLNAPPGAGAAGRHRGGEGVVREIEALRELTFSLIAERRRHPPRGAAGGGPGARGLDLLDGAPLAGKATGTLAAGQRLRIHTPGGGGFG